MRMSVAVLTILAAGVLAGPAPSATSSTPSDEGERPAATAQTSQRAISEIKKRVIALTNKKRVDNGCSRVKSNAKLGRAAQKHSKRMADASTLSHQLPGEPSIPQRFRNEGYDWTWWGENVAWNQRTAREVVNWWWNSPQHKANILTCQFKHIGIGVASNDAGQPYWTQDFGRN